MNLARTLAAFEADLVAAGTPVVDRLAPGLAPATVRAQLNDAGRGVTDDVVTWFSWHNGLRPTAPPIGRYGDVLITRWRPYRLNESLESAEQFTSWARDHQRASERVREREGIEEWWPTSWVPIVTDAVHRLRDVVVDTESGKALRIDGEDRIVEPIGRLSDLVDSWRAALAVGLYWDTERAWTLPSPLLHDPTASWYRDL